MLATNVYRIVNMPLLIHEYRFLGKTSSKKTTFFLKKKELFLASTIAHSQIFTTFSSNQLFKK
jgi:uncharacterized membrane-anchored protein YitT (DUF2179 family)